MKRSTRTISGALVVGVMALSLTACNSVKTFASQCAYVIQHGYFDAHHIKEILLPGARANANGDTVKYVYCNARNYLVATGSSPDLTAPVSVRTESIDGDAGQQIELHLAVYWQLNQNKDALTAFLPFCEKYNCFSSSSSVSDSGNHSSSAGWNTMLEENFAPTLQRAAVEAAVNSDSGLPNEQNKWPALGDAIAKNFMNDVEISDGQLRDGGGQGINFFCASGSSDTNCAPVSVQVQSVEYANSNAQALSQQSSTLTQQQQLNVQKLQQQDQLVKQQQQVNADTLNAAKAKYGAAASQVIGELDIIAACKDAGTQCIITLGSGNQPQVTVPAK